MSAVALAKAEFPQSREHFTIPTNFPGVVRSCRVSTGSISRRMPSGPSSTRMAAYDGHAWSCRKQEN